MNPPKTSPGKIRKTAMGDTQSSLKEAQAAVQRGDKVQARLLLDKLVSLEPNNEQAWLLSAQVASGPDEEEKCLHQALVIRPDTPEVSWRLAKIVKEKEERKLLAEGKEIGSDANQPFTLVSFLSIIVMIWEFIDSYWLVPVAIGIIILLLLELPALGLVLSGIAFLTLLVLWIKKVYIDKKYAPFSVASGYIWMALAFTLFTAALWYYFVGVKYVYP
jgi:hypothetical protein